MSVTQETAALYSEMQDLIKENESILADLQVVIESFKAEQAKREVAHAEIIAKTTERTEKNKSKIEQMQSQIDFAVRLDEQRGKEDIERFQVRKAAFSKLRDSLIASGIESEDLEEYEAAAGYSVDIEEEAEGDEPEAKEDQIAAA